MAKILITGSGSGLGAHLRAQLIDARHQVIAFDILDGLDVRRPAETYGLPPDDLDILVNCAGINQAAWLENVTEQQWDEVMGVNAKGIFMMSSWAAAALRRSKGTILNIVSNASHMPMRTSLAYNASKGAAHIMTLQLARELSPDITVFGVSPNKLRGTGMSHDIERQVCELRGWTPDQAEAYQRASLLSGEETEPAVLAEFITFLLAHKHRHKYLTGCVLPYGA
jgi:meso-butanediol dehydrogenase/(S,S)-butanediol dehydrogenase/diacetyl reductase